MVYPFVEYWSNSSWIIMKRLWRLWAQALGEKTGENDREADAVARFRTILILQGVVTNILISINILMNWLK